MTKVFTGILFLAFISLRLMGQDQVFQSHSINQVFKNAKNDNKGVFVLFGTTHCGWAFMEFHELANDSSLTSYIKDGFVCLGYGDKEVTSAKKFFTDYPGLSELHLKEKEFETVLTNSFVSPNYFFFNKNGDISFINHGMKKPNKVLKYAQHVDAGKTKTPFLFALKFNNGMYPKNKKSYKMLSLTVKAYLLKQNENVVDYQKPLELEVFNYTKANAEQAKQNIENSFKYGDYYFNCFLASVIYKQTGDNEQAKLYANKCLNDFPKYFKSKREHTDNLMKLILEQD